MKEFSFTVSDSEAKYQIDADTGLIVEKKNGGQSSYNITTEFFDYAKSQGIVVQDDAIEYSRKSKDGSAYVLGEGYKLVLGKGVLWLIGEHYKECANKFIASKASNDKYQFFRVVYNDLASSDSGYRWFVDLYDKNLKGSKVSLTVDEEKKEISIDVSFVTIKKIVKDTEIASGSDNEKDSATKFARNRIIFGAPGTGKSNTLDRDKKELLSGGGEYERVTFHPDYSYAQFVGTYKPVSYKGEDGNNKIEYKFVPGPFTRILREALKNCMSVKAGTDTAKPYLLIIEELNRAKTAAVFGDVFQLLDRGDDGVSEYDIQTSEDLRKYLSQELGVSEDEVASIRIPDNMFIWATMNSADQGVFPLDTAFKRRWNFEYIGVDGRADGDYNDLSFNVKHDDGKDKQNEVIYWDEIRRSINNYLSGTNMKVHEDKLLGPFYIKKPAGVKDVKQLNEKCIDLFCDKVLMYLFDDVVKTRRDKLFTTPQCNRFSEIRNDFLKRGTKIFVKEVVTEYEDLVKSRDKGSTETAE